MMNIPNTLTIIRILAVPAFIAVFLSPFQGNTLIALTIFLLAALTDMMDGLWARKKKQITVLGQLLDPTADKLLIVSAFICFVELNIVAAWIAIIIIGREIAVSGFRAIASSRGVNIAASKLGKIKMSSEVFTVALLILGKKYLGNFYFLAYIGLGIVIIAGISSAIQYYIKFISPMKSQQS